MVSLGYSIGDFITIGHLAWNVYRSCKDAPGSFSNISLEVLSLHAVLKEVGETLSDGDDGSILVAQSTRLSTLKDSCEGVLKDLQDLINRYESLGTKSKRTWDRLGWGLQDIAELRSRLTSNTVLLTAFISTSQLTVERTLNKFLQEFRDGKHEGSVITNQTVESLSTDEKEIWRSIRKELEDIGVTVAAFEANKAFIIEWFKQSTASGVFDGEIPDAESDTVSSIHLVELGSGQAIQQLGSSSPDQLTTEAADPPPGSDKVSLVLQELQPSQTPTSKRSYERSTRGRSNETAILNRTGPHQVYNKSKRDSRLPSLLVRALGLDNGLYNAARDGNLARVRDLLRKGANIEKGSGEDSTLCVAAVMGHIGVVELLLEKGANIEGICSLRRTPLHLAALLENIAMVDLLLQKGANTEARTTWTLDFPNVKTKGDEAYQRSFDPSQVFSNAGSIDRTVLQLAAMEGSEKVVRLLVDHGADIEATSDGGVTALLDAASKGHVLVVGLLLEKGADIKAVDNRIWTALHRAASGDQVPVVRMLLEKGAEIKAVDNRRWTALHHAAFYGHSTMVQFLLDMGADANVRACYWECSKFSDAVWTSLHIAAEKGHEAVAQSLLRDGKADVELRTQDLDTALHKAARRGTMGVVRVLLDHGARIETENMAKETPLSLAIEGRHYNVQGLLNYARLHR